MLHRVACASMHVACSKHTKGEGGRCEGGGASCACHTACGITAAACGGAVPQADDAALREVERKAAGTARQADANAEGLRTLTGGTFKRLDEHASAIQKLTLVSCVARHAMPCRFMVGAKRAQHAGRISCRCK